MAISTATVIVNVACCQVVANDDSASVSVPGVAIPNVRINDFLCAPEATTLTAETVVPPELSFNTATGAVSVQPDATAGVYSFTYRLATANTFDLALVTVTYEPPVEECYPPVCSCTVPFCG